MFFFFNLETYEVEVPDDEADDGDIDDEDEEQESDNSVPMLELVPSSMEKDMSGNNNSVTLYLAPWRRISYVCNDNCSYSRACT